MQSDLASCDLKVPREDSNSGRWIVNAGLEILT
jgi:hypothetical protein